MTTTINAEPNEDVPEESPDEIERHSAPSASWVHRIGLDRFSGLYLLAAFFIFFGITENNFLVWNGSIEFVLTEKVIVVLLALAFLVPLTTQTFDLSIGATMALSLVIVNKVALETDLPDGVGALLGMLACLVIGALNGFIVVKLRVNSFIATLGMSQVIAAIIRRIHDGGNITNAFGESYINFGKSSLFSFKWPWSDTQIELPYYFFFGLIVATIIWYVLEHTPVGRKMFATGGNAEAARLSGVKTDRMAWGSLIASAGIAGFAGLIYSWKFAVYTSSVGPPLLFTAVGAVFFGASQLKGRPNVWGTIIAVYVLAFGIKGIGLRYPSEIDWMQPMFEGLTLIVAVAVASRQAVVKVNRRRTTDSGSDSTPEQPSPTNKLTDDTAVAEPTV
ncbi:ABC transporter permease [Ilumatobacter nonamiensis]|uniref:ABC transporter permease n=1 Tax=Ilumatobacter nonamiensis TaxID=467093 RepID=UPI000349000B|nr:ABC transporter permease [Ilumatobacter nonamiensis]